MKRLSLSLAVLLLGLGAGTTALAQGRGGAYQQETAVCGHNKQDRSACLREAGAARQAASKGQLTSAPSYQANALARCGVFKDAGDRAACEARVTGSGQTQVQGDVMGGGLIRETSTPVQVAPR